LFYPSPRPAAGAAIHRVSNGMPLIMTCFRQTGRRGGINYRRALAGCVVDTQEAGYWHNESDQAETGGEKKIKYHPHEGCREMTMHLLSLLAIQL
jgi:hypothetical protein